jgi:hypothetical protein
LDAKKSAAPKFPSLSCSSALASDSSLRASTEACVLSSDRRPARMRASGDGGRGFRLGLVPLQPRLGPDELGLRDLQVAGEDGDPLLEPVLVVLDRLDARAQPVDLGRARRHLGRRLGGRLLGLVQGAGQRRRAVRFR